MLPISHHAQARLQQRGIPPAVVERLLDFGRETYDHRGGTILFFDHQARKTLRRRIEYASATHLLCAKWVS